MNGRIFVVSDQSVSQVIAFVDRNADMMWSGSYLLRKMDKRMQG